MTKEKLCPKPPSIVSIVTGAYTGDLKKVVSHARCVADQWDAAGEDFSARIMRDLCDKIERGEVLQRVVALRHDTEFCKVMGRRISDHRKSRNLSQEELGHLIGLAGANMALVESGDQEITSSQVYLLSQALRTPVGSLFPEPLPVPDLTAWCLSCKGKGGELRGYALGPGRMADDEKYFCCSQCNGSGRTYR